MKKQFKYVITDDGAILFDEPLTHSLAAAGTKQINRPIYSAGFCNIDFSNTTEDGTPHIECYGESVSLHLLSIPALDTIVIAALFAELNPIRYHILNVAALYKGNQK